MPNFGREPKGPVEKSLWRFAKTANLSVLHDADLRRFDEFTVTAHPKRRQWTAHAVRDWLLKRRVKKVLVNELGDAR